MQRFIILGFILPLLCLLLGCSEGPNSKESKKSSEDETVQAAESNAIDHSGFGPFMETFTKAITEGKRSAYQEVLPNPGYASDILEGLEGANVTRIEVYQDTVSVKSYGVFFDNGESIVVAATLWQGKIEVNSIGEYR